MCTQARSGPVSLFRFWIGGPHTSLPRHIPGTDQPLTLTPPDSESPLAAESVPIDASGLYKIAHSVDGNGSGKGNPACRFRKFDPAWVRLVRQKHCIIRAARI